MDTVWVLVEHEQGRPLDSSLELVSAAGILAEEVEAFAFGDQASETASILGAHGVGRLTDLGDVGDALPAPRVAAALAATMKARGAPSALLVPMSHDGRDIAARLSVKLDLPVITNVVDLVRRDEGLVASHAIFGGTEIARSRFYGVTTSIFLVRAKSFAIELTGGRPAKVEHGELLPQGSTDVAKVVERSRSSEDEGPALDDAQVVVSGGRGLGSKENYRLVEELAGVLHGAAGASRAIVDAGWVTYSRQVGQTGKTVKPDVYIACGISGAVQHIAGMKSAKHIIAINTDEHAPILDYADLAVVGDAISLLPRLIKALSLR